MQKYNNTVVFYSPAEHINHRKTNKIIDGINSILGPDAVTLSWLDGTLEWNRESFYHNETSKCLDWSAFGLQGFFHATFNYATPQSTCQSHLTAWWTILCFMTVSCNVILHTYSIKLPTCQTVSVQVKGDNDSRDNANIAAERQQLELPCKTHIIASLQAVIWKMLSQRLSNTDSLGQQIVLATNLKLTWIELMKLTRARGPFYDI